MVPVSIDVAVLSFNHHCSNESHWPGGWGVASLILTTLLLAALDNSIGEDPVLDNVQDLTEVEVFPDVMETFASSKSCHFEGFPSGVRQICRPARM